jgi:3-hydroxyisobutyrate dehydrogenase
MADNPKIGWIGTGVMGAPMAGHLLAAGYPLRVFNRTKSKAEGLLQRGAVWADSPAAVARECDIVLAIVGFPADVRETFLGEQGILQTLRPGAVAVDMTTSPPSLAREISEKAAQRQACALDAPVSGGQMGAEGAKLTIMVGGEKAVFERALPLFQKMGKAVTWMGPAGSGQHTKMVNQILIAGHMLALSESLCYASACGINPQTAVEAVSQGAANSFALQTLGPRILKRDFAAGFFVDHFVKDLGIALDEAKKMKLPLPMLALAEQMYVALQAQGHGRLGTQALFKVYESLCGGKPGA